MLQRLLTWDKMLHFMYMYAIQITIFVLFPAWAPWTLFSSLVIPVAKEVYDKVKGNTFDLKDMFASIIGGVVSYFIYAW